MKNMFSLLAALIALFAAQSAQSHELWIEPSAYQVEIGSDLTATLKNGQNLAGVSLAWYESRQDLFDWVLNGTRTAFQGRAGDIPTVTLTPPEAGLLVLAFQSKHLTVDYETWDAFQRFAEHKDLFRAAERHAERGLPDAEFTEAYTRHAKALIAVGDGGGEDSRLGLVHEFVALTNPYTDPDEPMAVQLFYDGQPSMDAQVEIFDRAPDGEVTVSTTRTNSDGVADIPLTRGHSYLLDSVWLREPSDALAAETGAVWETLWAALTFAVPE